MEETTASTGMLTSPSPVISLPFDLVEEILSRLPVKFLLQLRCVCKIWNSLISNDPKFAKKHHRVSTPRHHLVLIPIREDINVISYPLHSVFTTTTNNATQLQYPLNNNQTYYHSHRPIGSCDGLLCFAIDQHHTLLWNPCINKFKKLPYLENPQEHGSTTYGFGYDPFTDNYKLVAVYHCDSSGITEVHKTQVKVHSLGTDSWRTIQEFPSNIIVHMCESGKFVSGTVNWLASPPFIVSLDLGNESYQEILQPDYGGVGFVELTSGVLSDCLCIFSHTYSFTDVWLMKEHGNIDSWIKLIRLPYLGDRRFFYDTTNVVYISEDDHVLLVGT